MNEHSLLVFSIGPVQSFIAAARKIEDLWSGSYLLSYLTQTAMISVLKEAKELGVKARMIYPARSLQELEDVSNHDNIEVASIPNRFVVWVDSNQAHSAGLAAAAEKAVREQFRVLCTFAIKRVFPNTKDLVTMESLAEQQVNALLEMFWTTEKVTNENDYPQARKAMEKRLAAVKNRRPYSLNPQEGLVCTLCGQQQALLQADASINDPYSIMKKNACSTWGKRGREFLAQEDGKGRIQDGELLCAICLAKRVLRDYMQQELCSTAFRKFDSTHEIAGKKPENLYYAIIMMDGDDMGKWLSGQNDEQKIDVNIEYHQDLSNRLARFAMDTVPVIVKDHEGCLIYAGGDDVLAFIKIDKALALARALRLAFSDESRGLNKQATASMGMVVAHAKAPLQMVLTEARRQEARAKSYRYPMSSKAKDALSIAVITHSGEMREATIPWTMDGQTYSADSSACTVSRIRKIQALIHNDLSITFMQHFTEAFLPLLGTDVKKGKKLAVMADPQENYELLCTEMCRLLKRSLKETNSDINISEQARLLIDMHAMMPSTLQFIHLLEMVRFFKRKEEQAQ